MFIPDGYLPPNANDSSAGSQTSGVPGPSWASQESTTVQSIIFGVVASLLALVAVCLHCLQYRATRLGLNSESSIQNAYIAGLDLILRLFATVVATGVEWQKVRHLDLALSISFISGPFPSFYYISFCDI